MDEDKEKRMGQTDIIKAQTETMKVKTEIIKGQMKHHTEKIYENKMTTDVRQIDNEGYNGEYRDYPNEDASTKVEIVGAVYYSTKATPKLRRKWKTRK